MNSLLGWIALALTAPASPLSISTPDEPGANAPASPEPPLVLETEALQADALQIKATEIVLPDGSRIPGGVVVVENGKFTRVGEGDLDERFASIEHDGVLTAGFVACQTLSGTGAESSDLTRAILP